VDESEPSDAELLRRLTAGDHRALAAVFDRHAIAVTRYAWAMATSRMDVEEIVQDTFVTVWRRSAAIVLAEASLLPWLLVTCRNLARNAARRAARNHADGLDALETSASGAFRSHYRDVAARDELRWVLDEIARLDPIDRRVCELCLLEGVPYADAATMLGMSSGAVKQRVSRNRARLRKAVTFDEV
jgi:RNA polymerase sigma-70 factor (ECF subfamily)